MSGPHPRNPNQHSGPDPYGPPIPFRGPGPISSGPSANVYWALGLAVASFVACGCVAGIPAFVMARAELAAIERGESPANGKPLATVAFFLGLFNIIVSALLVLGYVLALVFSG